MPVMNVNLVLDDATYAGVKAGIYELGGLVKNADNKRVKKHLPTVVDATKEGAAKAIDMIFHNGINGETYNVGGHNELTNLDITHTICAILDDIKPRTDGKKYAELITFVKDRAGHDLRYAIDPTKIENILGYKPDETFKTGIVKTVKWYLDKA